MESLAEVWRDVLGFEGCYIVSNRGSVRSLERQVVANGHGGVKTIRPRMLSRQVNPVSGYEYVNLWRENKVALRSVHSLVASAFVSPRPIGMVVNHIDGNKRNNAATNLEYVSQKRNCEHASEIGLLPHCGTGNRLAKFSDADIANIRNRRNAGVKLTVLAAQYGVAKQTISKIAIGRAWKHVP